MSWETVSDDCQGGGEFIRLGSGDSITVVFVGEPVIYTNTRFDRPKRCVMINAYDVADEEMKIWDTSTFTFRLLLDLREKYGLDRPYVLSRTGSGPKDTRYTLMPDPDGGKQEGLGACICEEHQLHDLDAIAEAKEGAGADGDTDDVPF